MSKTKASILGICRLRIGTDGHGVRTLVAFQVSGDSPLTPLIKILYMKKMPHGQVTAIGCKKSDG